MCDMEERVVDILGTSCKGHIKTKPLKKQNVTSRYVISLRHLIG